MEKWEALSLCLQIQEQLLGYFGLFSYPKQEVTHTEMHELIITHINKMDLLQLLEYILEVGQKYEDSFENVHWSESQYRNSTIEYCNTLISAITKAAIVLDKGLELLYMS